MPITELRNPTEMEQSAVELPAYVPPTVTTYTDELLLDALGPAQAGGGYSPP